MALQLAASGASLGLGDIDLNGLTSLAEECKQLGSETVIVQTDVTQQADCRSLVDQTVTAFGRLDMLVNNAGVSMWTLFEDIQDMRMIERLMQINYMGSVYCTHYALPHLKASRGRIVGVVSLAGKTGIPNRTGYAASKHAMVGFFDSLRIEQAANGISVTLAFPDWVATELRRNAYDSEGKPLGESPIEEGKAMTAAECAELILAAAAKRKRELLTSTRSRLGQWLKLIFPKRGSIISVIFHIQPKKRSIGTKSPKTNTGRKFVAA